MNVLHHQRQAYCQDHRLAVGQRAVYAPSHSAVAEQSPGPLQAAVPLLAVPLAVLLAVMLAVLLLTAVLAMLLALVVLLALAAVLAVLVVLTMGRAAVCVPYHWAVSPRLRKPEDAVVAAAVLQVLWVPPHSSRMGAHGQPVPSPPP